VTLAAFNALPDTRAEEELLRCCGSKEWARKMAGFRPYESVNELHKTATDIWWALTEQDWLEAFTHHPRIGEGANAAGWARDEQSGTKDAASDVMKQLARANKDYEHRFGHVFLIYATGKSADEMLGGLKQRLENDARTELRNAAAEQAKITKLRLEKLIND
jgi:2-oxo-4-hydroxy-4-carboxy-5-ureidoimidazoline decarboxylase